MHQRKRGRKPKAKTDASTAEAKATPAKKTATKRKKSSNNDDDNDEEEEEADADGKDAGAAANDDDEDYKEDEQPAENEDEGDDTNVDAKIVVLVSSIVRKTTHRKFRSSYGRRYCQDQGEESRPRRLPTEQRCTLRAEWLLLLFASECRSYSRRCVHPICQCTRRLSQVST